jgi:acyl-CoA hydrolase
MDTDDLSTEAYDGILSEAEKLTHDLTLHYGLLSESCNNEAEYIEKAEKLTREIMEAEDYELDDLFWGNAPDKIKLDSTLKKILKNIEKVKSIPIKKRNYDF